MSDFLHPSKVARNFRAEHKLGLLRRTKDEVAISTLGRALVDPLTGMIAAYIDESGRLVGSDGTPLVPAGQVLLVRSNGTKKSFMATADTDVARGTALAAALAACVSGDVVYIGPGNYSTTAGSGFTLPQGASLIGSGMFATNLINASTGSVVCLGVTGPCYVADLSAKIPSTAGNNIVTPVSMYTQAASGVAQFWRVNAEGATDGWYANGVAGVCDCLLVDCRARSNYDSFTILAIDDPLTGNATIINPDFISTGPNGADTRARGICILTTATARVYGGSVSAANGGITETVAVRTANNGQVYLYGTKLSSSGSPSHDIYSETGGVVFVSGAQYDPTKTFGTLTKLTGDRAASGTNTDITELSAAAGVKIGSAGVALKRLRFGTAVLVGGTVVVSDANVTATSNIQLTSQVNGGTPGFLRVSARSAGVSFTILSSSGTDTSTVGWVAFEP